MPPTPRRRAPRSKAGPGRRADAVPDAAVDDRRRAAADRAVHRDRRAPSSTPKGRVQSFHGVVKPLGETRPAWKVLRVLGNLLGLRRLRRTRRAEEVRAEALGDAGDVAARLDNAPALPVRYRAARGRRGLERIADVPIYFTDPLVRRSPPLQTDADARAAGGLDDAARAVAQLGPAGGDAGARHAGRRRSAAAGRASTTRLPDGCVRVAAGHADDRGAGRDVRPGQRREGVSAHDELADQRLRHLACSSSCSAAPGRSVWTLIKIVALVLPLMLLRRLPDAVGAQGDRLDPDPPRARTASARSACCSRSPTR